MEFLDIDGLFVALVVIVVGIIALAAKYVVRKTGTLIGFDSKPIENEIDEAKEDVIEKIRQEKFRQNQNGGKALLILLGASMSLSSCSMFSGTNVGVTDDEVTLSGKPILLDATVGHDLDTTMNYTDINVRWDSADSGVLILVQPRVGVQKP